jgi:hypothetical protein
MIPWITLGVTLASLAVLLFLLWVLAAPKQEEEVTYAVGFRYTTPEEDESQDGC